MATQISGLSVVPVSHSPFVRFPHVYIIAVWVSSNLRPSWAGTVGPALTSSPVWTKQSAVDQYIDVYKFIHVIKYFPPLL